MISIEQLHFKPLNEEVHGIKRHLDTYYCESLKTPPYFLNNLVKDQPILIVFGMQHLEETLWQNNTYVPTSPTDVTTLPWEAQESYFSTIFNNNLD